MGAQFSQRSEKRRKKKICKSPLKINTFEQNTLSKVKSVKEISMILRGKKTVKVYKVTLDIPSKLFSLPSNFAGLSLMPFVC